MLTAIVVNIYDNLSGALTWEHYVGLWFLLSLVTDLGFGLATAYSLLTRFRTLALRGYAPAPRALWHPFTNRLVSRTRASAKTRTV